MVEEVERKISRMNVAGEEMSKVNMKEDAG
jgi:hypothetical protein